MANERLKTLGNNIRAERMRKRLSQMKLAELVNISTDSLFKIENAKQTPSAFIIFDIATVLNIPIEELFKYVPKIDSN